MSSASRLSFRQRAEDSSWKLLANGSRCLTKNPRSSPPSSNTSTKATIIQDSSTTSENSWELESGDGGAGSVESTVYHHGIDGELLKDTVIYCTAEKYGLEELKRVALRKQGLQSGIQCSTILSSARYAYANTPDTDSKLRAHYLALIIRSRNTFKRSGTMQLEMQTGGSQLFFDLFVALCNHVDDVASIA